MQEAAGKQGIGITLSCDEGLEISADKNGLKQVLLNLLMNAVEAAGFGCPLTDREKNTYVCMNAAGDLQGLAGKTIKTDSEVVRSLLEGGSSVQSGKRLRVPVISERGGPGLSGFFIFSEKRSGDGFSGIDTALMETFANQTAVSIENAILCSAQ